MHCDWLNSVNDGIFQYLGSAKSSLIGQKCYDGKYTLM